MPHVKRWHVVVRIKGVIHYACKDPDRPLPHCTWKTTAEEYPDHWTQKEARSIQQKYSDQRPYVQHVWLNPDNFETEDA